MMGRLRAMREPLKYVQGRDALLKFQEEMGYMGKDGCLSVQTAATKHAMIKLKKALETVMTTDAMRFSAESPATVKLQKWPNR